MNCSTCLYLCCLFVNAVTLSSAESLQLSFPEAEKHRYSIKNVEPVNGTINVKTDKRYDLTFNGRKDQSIPLYFTKNTAAPSDLPQKQDPKSGLFSTHSEWSETSAPLFEQWYHKMMRSTTQQATAKAKQSYLKAHPDTKKGLVITVSHLTVDRLIISDKWEAKIIISGNILVMPKKPMLPENPIVKGERFEFSVPQNLINSIKIDGFDSLVKPVQAETGKAYTMRVAGKSYKTFLIPATRKTDVHYRDPEGKSTGSSDWEAPGMGGIFQTMMMLQASATSHLASTFTDTISIKDQFNGINGRSKTNARMKNVKNECVFLSSDGNFKMYISATVIRAENK